MSAAAQEGGESSVLQLGPEMTIYHAVETKARLYDALSTAGAIRLDLSGVTTIDTAGVQLLVLAKREAARTGKELALVGHSDASLAAIDAYDLLAFFGDPVVISSGGRAAAGDTAP